MEWDEDEIVVEITADVVEVEIAETGTDVSIDEEKIELEVAAPEETGLEITEDLIELELIADPEIVIEVGEGKAVWGFITGELPDQTDLAAALAGKSDTGHNHDDRYYTEQEIDAALAVISAALSGKSDVGHTHDDRYYTQGEIDAALSVINTALAGKLNLSGGTMTGRLIMNSASPIQLNGNNLILKTPGESSDDTSDIVWFYSNDQEKMRVWANNEYTAKAGPNFRIYKKDGTVLFAGTLSLSDHTHDTRYVLKSGDTMTGALAVKNNNIDTDVVPASSSWTTAFCARDVNNRPVLKLQTVDYPSGKQGLQIETERTISGTRYTNNLYLTIDQSGIKYVEVSDKSAWLTALGAAASSHTHDDRYLLKTLASIEFHPASTAGHGGFIDFHYNGSSADYTARIIEGQNYVSLVGKKLALNAAPLETTYGGTGASNASDARTNLGVPAKADAIKNITRSGTTFTATRADGTTFTFTQQDEDTKYTAGTGLGLSGTSFYIPVPRVAESCNTLPSAVASLRFREYTAGGNYNLPSSAWYHILEIRSYDSKYGTQLALGMTTNAAYYRKFENNTWGEWKSLTDVGDNIKVKSVSATMGANSNSANITASPDSGYTFLTWYGANPVGFGGVFHFSNFATASTTVWQDYGATTSSRTVTCYFMEKK